MKTTKTRIGALVLACLLVLTLLTGCSQKFKSVGDYLADEKVRTELTESLTELEGTGITCEFFADGNTLVYSYTYEEQLDLSDEGVKQQVADTLKELCEQQNETYAGVIEALHTVISADDIKVRLVYNNADGSEIYTHLYE